MKKELRTNQQNLLRLLKRLESADEKGRGPATRELVQELITICGSPEKASILVNISVPTLYRWSSGGSAPRSISRLKEALANPNFDNQLKRLSGTFTLAHDPGIHSVEVFFERARLASKILIFKSFIGFEFGHSERLQQQMEELLEQNENLTIHCIFPSMSRADETLSRFCELARSFEQHWINKIKKHSIDDNDQLLALGLGITGQIILEYTPEGRKQMGRFLDFMVEIPVRVYEQSEPNIFIKRTIWVELPADEVQTIWPAWKTFLEAKKILPAERSALHRIV